jgi:hypothetical protein
MTTEPEPTATGGRAAGGTGGKADAGAIKDSAGTGGMISEPDAAVVPVDVGVTGGAGGAPEDAAAGGTGGGTGGAGGMSATGGQSGTPDAARPPVSGGGTAACHPDPNVIEICKQLEPACQNCPDRSVWDECFRVSAAGNDAACARYARDNNCTVDQGGNWCGSLNCTATGCPRTDCRQVQGNGASAPCQALIDECPCQ